MYTIIASKSYTTHKLNYFMRKMMRHILYSGCNVIDLFCNSATDFNIGTVTVQNVLKCKYII